MTCYVVRLKNQSSLAGKFESKGNKKPKIAMYVADSPSMSKFSFTIDVGQAKVFKDSLSGWKWLTKNLGEMAELVPLPDPPISEHKHLAFG